MDGFCVETLWLAFLGRSMYYIPRDLHSALTSLPVSCSLMMLYDSSPCRSIVVLLGPKPYRK